MEFFCLFVWFCVGVGFFRLGKDHISENRDLDKIPLWALSNLRNLSKGRLRDYFEDLQSSL